MAIFKDLTGMKFGRLLVIRRSNNKNGRVCFECLCDCGNTKITYSTALKGGDTRSCGCLHIEHAMTHVRNKTYPVGTKRIHKQSGRTEIKTEHGFIREHIYIIEKMIGRKLHHHECVHHIDHDKTNNDPSNLRLMTISEHTILHSTGRKFRKETREAIARSQQRYSEMQVSQLKEMVSNGHSQKSAANAIGMSQMTASRIIRGLTYKEFGNGES